jgi:hypothetical protein
VVPLAIKVAVALSFASVVEVTVLASPVNVTLCWIADLFPYLFGAPPASRPMGSGLCAGAAARRNHVLSTPREDWLLPAPSSPMAGNGVNLQNFPSGLSRAPVKLTLPDGAQTQLELLVGFLGVSQRAEDNALAPVVSWVVVQKS